MTEDHVDPDWDGIMGRLDGQPSPDELREAREAGARAMMDMLLGVAVKRMRGVNQQAVRDTGFRVMAVAYLAQHPVTQNVGNLQRLAEKCGVSSKTAERTITEITRRLGVLEPVAGKCRAHKRR
jgi:hypothetical protein